MKKEKRCLCGANITDEKYSQHICSIPFSKIKKKNILPDSHEQSHIYFRDNDKLSIVGALRCLREGKVGNHIFTNYINVPKFHTMYPGLIDQNISSFIENFVSGHSRSHEGKLIKITVEIIEE